MTKANWGSTRNARMMARWARLIFPLGWISDSAMMYMMMARRSGVRSR